MSERNLKLIEKYFKEMYDLDIKRQVYSDIRIGAITKRTGCMLNDDRAGAIAWDTVVQDCNDNRILIGERIKDLYAECIRLKAMEMA